MQQPGRGWVMLEVDRLALEEAEEFSATALS